MFIKIEKQGKIKRILLNLNEQHESVILKPKSDKEEKKVCKYPKSEKDETNGNKLVDSILLGKFFFKDLKKIKESSNYKEEFINISDIEYISGPISNI